MSRLSSLIQGAATTALRRPARPRRRTRPYKIIFIPFQELPEASHSAGGEFTYGPIELQ